MKKIFCISLFTLLIVNFINAQQITVKVPNGGEQFGASTSNLVQWTSVGIPIKSKFFIEYSYNNGANWIILDSNFISYDTNNHQNSFNFPFTPTYGAISLGSPLITTGAKVRISLSNNKNIKDENNSTFTVEFVLSKDKLINEIETNSFFPNPVNNELNILIIEVGNSPIQLINLNGKIVYEGQVQNNFNKINTSTFPNGIYILSFIKNNKLSNQKVLIHH